MSLLKLAYNNQPDLYMETKRHLESGADPNERSPYNETALNVTARLGRFDVVKLLIDFGADKEQLKWTPLFEALAFGTIEDAKTILMQESDIKARDYWDRTPLHLAIQTGQPKKVELILKYGANLEERGHCEKLALEYAFVSDDSAMLEYLIQKGADIHEYNGFGNTLLIEATLNNAIKCVRSLIKAGADVLQKDRSPHGGTGAMAHAENPEIVFILFEAGGDLNDTGAEVRGKMLGLGKIERPDIKKDEYMRSKYRIFGTKNPEISHNKFWREMVKANCNAWKPRDLFDDTEDLSGPPVWCYNRFGKSINRLPNGEFIEIGGEHEDFYDPDFCIYNDVIHHKGNGDFDIYTYPKEIFPPTDFHTATLVENHIYIIGNLCYHGQRKFRDTPVYRLNTKTFVIEKVETYGENPGWIYSHKAYLEGDDSIKIKGGKIIALQDGKEAEQSNRTVYELCLKTLKWSRLHDEVETSFFPEEYKNYEFYQGMILGTESQGKWQVVKVLGVELINLKKDQTVQILGQKYTLDRDDYLYAIGLSYSHDFETEEDMKEAAQNGEWGVKVAFFPRRPSKYDRSNFKYLGFGEVSEAERKPFLEWKRLFEKGEAGIF